MLQDEVREKLKLKMQEIVTELAERAGFRQTLAVKIDEDFRPTLHECTANGPIVSSGGFQVIMALAMRLALMNLGKIRGVLLLDEPFVNVDEQWRKGFLDLLKQKRWGVDQVVEISSLVRSDHTTGASPDGDDSRGNSSSDRETVHTVCLSNGESVISDARYVSRDRSMLNFGST